MVPRLLPAPHIYDDHSQVHCSLRAQAWGWVFLPHQAGGRPSCKTVNCFGESISKQRQSNYCPHTARSWEVSWLLCRTLLKKDLQGSEKFFIMENFKHIQKKRELYNIPPMNPSLSFDNYQPEANHVSSIPLLTNPSKIILSKQVSDVI